MQNYIIHYSILYLSFLLSLSIPQWTSPRSNQLTCWVLPWECTSIVYCANKSINPFRTGTARQADEARGTGWQEGGRGYKNIFPKCETQVEAGGKTFASRHLTVQFGVPAWTEFFAILVGFGPHSCHVCVCVLLLLLALLERRLLATFFGAKFLRLFQYFMSQAFALTP